MYTEAFKAEVVARMERSPRGVSKLSHELKVSRMTLYRWRAAQNNQAKVGSQASERRIRELQRKVGEQELMIDFLSGACKRIEAIRRQSIANGETVSTPRREQ